LNLVVKYTRRFAGSIKFGNCNKRVILSDRQAFYYGYDSVIYESTELKRKIKKLGARGFRSKYFTAILLLNYTFLNNKSVTQTVQSVDMLL
jgi:hypothetical protein